LLGPSAACEHPRVGGVVAETRSSIAAVARNRVLRRALIAFGIFRPAESAQWIAILVFAYRAGGAGEMAVAAVVLLVPSALSAPLLAHLGDVLPRGRALALGYLAQGLAMGATAIALGAGAQAWIVFVFAAAANVAITMTRPVHLAILPDLAGSPNELAAANSLSSTIEGVSLLVGPVIAAIGLQASGPGSVYGIAAVGLLVAASIATTVGSQGGQSVRAEPRLRDALEGFRELRRRPGARVLLGFVAGQTAVIGALDVLVVVLALGMLAMGPAGPGVLSAAVGIGGLIGAAATVLLVGRDRLSRPFLFGVVAVGLPIACVAVIPSVAVALVLLAVSGVGKSFLDVTARTLLQRSVDDDVLARVFGVQEGANMAAMAIGSVMAPLLVSSIGARGAFAVVGLFLPIIALLALRPIRAVDRTTILVDPTDLRLLRATPIFAPLGPMALERAGRKLIPVDAPAGTVLMREGEPGDRFYVIADGQIQVTVGGRAVSRLGSGDYLGEIALLRNVPRTATATCLTPCSLRAMDRGAFLAIMTSSPVSRGIAHGEIDRRLSSGSAPSAEP
jgi:MFS family permease